MLMYFELTEQELTRLIPIMQDNIFSHWLSKPIIQVVVNGNEIGLGVDNLDGSFEINDLAMNMISSFIAGYEVGLDY